jgi:hypothetical protein
MAFFSNIAASFLPRPVKIPENLTAPMRDSAENGINFANLRIGKLTLKWL